MESISNDDPFTRKGLRKFLGEYFYSVWAEGDPATVEEAVDLYLALETWDDATGELLLSELDELIVRGLSNGQLVHLIEHDWLVDISSTVAGFTYPEMFLRIRNHLFARIQERET